MASKDIILALNKKYKSDVLSTANTLPKLDKVRLFLPTYDYLSDGGVPIGRVTEHIGENSSTKSYHQYVAIAEFQKYDFKNRVQRGKAKDKVRKNVVLIDIEGTYTKEWGEFLGIDNDKLILLVPDSLSQAVNVAETFLRDEETALVCMDGIASVGADGETDAPMEKDQMGINARFWNKAFRKLQVAMNNTRDSTLLVVNSSYDKIGIAYGDPTVPKCGNQLKLAKSLSMKFVGMTPLKKEIEGSEVQAGRIIKVTNVKNKCGVPFRKGEFYFSYVDEGSLKANTTNVLEQYIDLSLANEIVTRKGAFYCYKEGKKVQGYDAFIFYLEENPEIFDSIVAEVNNIIYGD